MELDAAGILAAVAAVVFAAHCPLARATVAALGGTYAAATLAVAAGVSPSVESIAVVVAVTAGAALAKPQWWALAPLAAAAGAAAWLSVLRAQGLPWLPATVAPIAVVAVAIALRTVRSGFVTAPMRDEALLLVASFALVLALGPGVMDGWRSAVALTAEPMGGAERAVSPWLTAVVVGSVLLGGVYSIWKRR